MSTTTVRSIGPEEWEQYRALRLEALRESPEAFVADYETETEYDESLWRERMKRSTRLLAEVDGQPVGIVSVRPNDEMFDDAAELFGLWVRPEHRSTVIAADLALAGANWAREQGKRHMLMWVGTENARMVGFASSYGFRPTEYRRPVQNQSPEFESEEELAMVLALGA